MTRVRIGALAAAAAAIGLMSCGGHSSAERAPKEGDSTMATRTAALGITSAAFGANQPIPAKHTADAEDVSPALSWSGAPGETRTFALICDDPDAPMDEPFVHWVMWNIPGGRPGLPEAQPSTKTLDDLDGAKQGHTSFGQSSIGYRGPAPPKGHGTHHYHFKVYALDTTLDLAPGASKGDLLGAMEGHVLAQGELIGTYER